MEKKITKAVFPVTGLGTRFLPATKASPKEMLSMVHAAVQNLLAVADAESCAT